MSTGTVSPSVTMCDPDGLRRAARLLLGMSQEVHQLAGRTRSAATVDGWLGVAAIQQQGRAAGLGALAESTMRPQEEVAGALHRCADVAETSAGRVRVWSRRAAELVAEQYRLRTMGPPPDPLLERAWRRRLEEVDVELARARRLVDEAEEAFDAAQRQAASVVSGAWSAVRELADLGQVLKDLGKIPGLLLKFPRRMVWTSGMLVALAQARWARAAPVRAIARQRLDVLLSRLRGLLKAKPQKHSWMTKLRAWPGPIGMVLAWFTAWTDVRTGGGYAGWRGGTTRVLAAGALVGGPLALVTPLAPPAGMVGIALVSVYQAWTAGNALWDGAPVLWRYARMAGKAGRDLVDRGLGVAGRARERVTDRLRDIRTRSQARTVRLALRAREGVRDRLDDLADLVDRLPDTAPLRDRLRSLGTPIRLPAVPLGPVLRAPVDLGWRWQGARP